MKKVFIPMLAVLFFSCGGNNQNISGADSANAIGGAPGLDTQVSPRPDGYAPPNAATDTSQHAKDSLDTEHH